MAGQRSAIGAAILVSVVLGGCAFVERSRNTLPRPTAPIPQAEITRANAEKLEVHRIAELRRMMLDSLPVGSIIAFYPSQKLAIPENWQICDGSFVTDTESVLIGEPTPNLLDDRFLMGSSARFGNFGGANVIPSDGGHDHGGRTLAGGSHDHSGNTLAPDKNGSKAAAKGSDARIFDTPHRHGIPSEPPHVHAIPRSLAHDHGGDLRPRWFGVLFLMKIK